MEELLTISETAAALKISPWTVRRWIYGKEIGSVKIGRSVRIPLTEIARKIKAGTTEANNVRT